MAPAAETAAPGHDQAAIGTTLGTLQHVGALKPSKLNPRRRFDERDMADLQANVAKHGVIVPIIGRQQKDHIEILDGERRWRAAKAADLKTVPVVFRNEMADGDAIEFMLLNQIQRQDLTPLEEAAGFKALIDSNKAKYSVGYIADRIGRSELFVWNRMKLLDLLPILKQLLEAGRILVGHAEILAKLKPEDQERALDWTRHHHAGKTGLWQTEHARLDLEDDPDDENPTAKNLYRGLKPVTVRELESWVAHHVRFDVEHMAKTAPLEFAPVAEAVQAAAAQPGRGKKVISITHDYRVDDDARDPSERTYGSQSWERADGQEKSKTCEHSVLGVFVAGPGYGTTLQVCVNRDKCTTHYGQAIKAREKNQKLRQQGKGGRAAQNEAKARQREEEERAKREAERKAWEALKPKLAAAVRAHLERTPLSKLLPVVAARYAKGAKTPDQLVRSLADRMAFEYDHYQAYFERDLKALGFDLKAWIGDQAAATEKKAASPAKAKAAKKAKKR